MISTKVSAASVEQYLPDGYRKKTAYLGKRNAGRVSVQSYWDGGSKNEFLLIRNGQRSDVGRSPEFVNGPGEYIDLQKGDVFVRHGVFCGKPATAFIEIVE